MKKAALFAAFAVLLTGCANGYDAGGIWRGSTRTGNSRFASTTALPGVDTASSSADYSCPAQDNVVPNFDRNFNGTDYYRVCTNPMYMTKIQVRGETFDGGAICVYPIQYVDEDHVFTKPDVTKGGPLSVCGAVDDVAGLKLDFVGVNYNAVMIASKTVKAQMDYCLSNLNTYDCPDFSYGKFR